MIQINIGGNDGAELLIDSQGGDFCFTVIVPKNSDRTQYDFGIESHEWELIKLFLDKQRELTSSQWDKATEELLEKRRDLWQRMADSDSSAVVGK